MNRFSTVTRAFLLVFFVFGLTSSAFADSWKAVKLRGAVFAFVDEQWVQLARGDAVSDDRIIRTAPNGRVQFKRDRETIDLGPNTQIRIYDRDGEKFTVVQQHFGDVAIEAERRDVQHIAVQTRYLAAVVKGTRFSVFADETSANVDVSRGQVQVRDVGRKLMVDVARNQSASVGSSEVLAVSGSGAHAPIVSYTGNAMAAEVEAVAVVDVGEKGAITVVAPASASTGGTVVTTTVGTPAMSNVIGTPAESVVVNTPAASKTAVSAATGSAAASDNTSTGTPAVSNTANTPAADVVANTPAATNTPPEHSNAGGKNK